MSGDDNVAAVVVDYYSKLFTTSDPCNIEEVVQLTKWVVSDEMNSNLIGNFSKEKVESALKQMAPLKAPGLMTCPLYFFNITGQA